MSYRFLRRGFHMRLRPSQNPTPIASYLHVSFSIVDIPTRFPIIKSRLQPTVSDLAITLDLENRVGAGDNRHDTRHQHYPSLTDIALAESARSSCVIVDQGPSIRRPFGYFLCRVVSHVSVESILATCCWTGSF